MRRENVTLSPMTSLPPAQEQQRLQALFDSACSHASAMNKRAVQASIDIGKEKTQYFEKIALACAGTIALVVSFVGSHAGRLQPVWLLRCSLITLVLAMMSAMYRNWKFPFYALACHAGEDMAAKQKKERARKDCIAAFPTFALEDGKLIDTAQWLLVFAENDKLFNDRIAECQAQENSAFNMTKRAEYVALLLTIISMIMLIALAWENV
jgi:hypothetical protein